ncbi:hypothetical protein I302_103670 [Kwoniella bestiolae CBS 10118]|uniref:Magnesium transporter n=1 Tax=Kwoniella bestiolae CBS 10118 TaxID=1296100 RepID=A0AAJ8M8H6_9TREE
MTSIRPETRYNLPQPIHASGLARAHPGLGPSPTYPSARSPIHPAGFSERIVIVKAQNFSHSTSRADAFEETMFPSGSHEVSTFLEKLERMMQGRGDGDCTWVRIYGTDGRLSVGMADLCGLPSGVFIQHDAICRPEHTLPLFESSIREMVLQIQVHPSMRPISLLEDPKASSVKLEHADVDGMIKVGFISVFIIPSVNVVITMTAQSYVCPATRLTEGPLFPRPKGISDHDMLTSDAHILALTFVHKAIGFASATVFSIAQIVKAWEGEARHSVSTTRAEEVHRLLFHLHTFRRHVRRYQIFHQELTEYYQTYDKEQDRQMQRTSCLAAKLLHQSEKTRHNALEDLQDLIDRGQSLEIFCFNMLSSRANDSMERLAIVTIVFLPLTFIASYFSMGFKDFTVLERSPSFFWKISVPLSVFFFLIFAYSTLKRLLKFTLNVFSRNIRTTQNTRSFQRLKYQWWQRPINIARRDRLIAKLKEIFRGFRTQDLPPPSYMPRENFTAWNAASTSYMPMPMVAAPINDGRYIPPFPHPPDDGIYPPRLYSTMSPGQRRPIPQ